MQNCEMEFTFSNCLATAKDELLAYLRKLNNAEVKPNVDERIKQVDDLIEAYVTATGHRPDSYPLYGLSGYILLDIITDQYKHARKDEYPFQTEGQAKKKHARHGVTLMGERTDI